MSPLIETLLIGEEAFRAFVYDDATGDPIRAGSIVHGHPTAGYGMALDVSPLTAGEALFLMRNRVAIARAGLSASLPWFTALGEVRQAVLLSMAYQMGVEGVLGFRGALGQMALGNWDGAAQMMLDSDWARETPARAEALATMMRTGQVHRYRSNPSE